MTPCGKDINVFMVACDTLLSDDLVATEPTHAENQIIQFYISALGVKFPPLT